MKPSFQRNVDSNIPRRYSPLASIVDYFTGTSRVDNEANPDSALNKRKREVAKSQYSWQARQKKQDMERAFSKTKVFGTPKK